MTRKQTRQKVLENQARRLRQQLAVLRRRSDRLVRWRLLLFMAGLAGSGVTLLTAGVWWWGVVSVVAAGPFFTAVYAHHQLEKGIRRYEIWLSIKETHLARMTLDWARIPAAEPVPPRLEHPFALDLDLIGDRSLHQLLDTAVSLGGSHRLRDWLLAEQPDQAYLIKRQALVQELARLTLFRDKLRLNATLVARNDGEKWPGHRLLDWLAAQMDLPALRPILLVLILLAAVNITMLLLVTDNRWFPWWAATWLLYGAISVWQLRRIGPMFEEAFFLRDGLEQLGAVFDFLERYRYGRFPHLQALCKPFTGGGGRPSQALKRIGRVVAAISLQKNPLVWFWLNAFIPWDIYFARRLNQCKRDLQTLLPVWLDAWFELEALNSLATFTHLNPDNIFPEIVSEQAVLFQAEAMGHPLIADETRIGNDFVIQQPGTIGLITGSNMAGKSSFLRAIGVNLALAYAGGPVLVRSLRVSLFRLYTSIRITDSVTDGFSYFYAEVQRLHMLLQALGDTNAPPLFFLIDEIFRGTNNRERLVGSRAYIRALAAGRGVGVIATHDLELAALADDLPGVMNYHFRDAVRNGRMIFDYQLRSGPCPTTNALKIMRLAGLPVEY